MAEQDKITWQEGLAASIVMVDFHLVHIRKLVDHPTVNTALKENKPQTTGAPLHLATSLGRIEIMQILLDLPMDVNGFASGYGSWLTPLHYAAMENKVEAAKLLIEYGANPDERGFMDALKGTPLDFAKNKGHKEMIEYLSNCTDEGEYLGDRKPFDIPKVITSAGSRRRSVGSAASRIPLSKVETPKKRDRSVPPRRSAF